MKHFIDKPDRWIDRADILLKLYIIFFVSLLVALFVSLGVTYSFIQQKEMISGQNITAYSSSVDETDSTPFEMANGERVFYGAVANNHYPFGTVVNIMGYEFVVMDRMNEWYDKNYWDIWQPSKVEAYKFLELPNRSNQDVIIYK